MSSPLSLSSAQAEDMAAFDRIIQRLELTEDDKFSTVICKLLPKLLERLTGDVSPVRTKILEVLSHINKRAKLLPTIQFPCFELVQMFRNRALSPFIRSFALVYLEMGFNRLPAALQGQLLPSIMSGISLVSESQQEILLHIFLTGMEHVMVPIEESERLKKIPFLESAGDSSCISDFLLDVVLCPSSGAVSPPGLSVERMKRLTGKSRHDIFSGDSLRNLKLKVLHTLSMRLFPVALAFPTVICGTCDPHHMVAERASKILKDITAGSGTLEDELTMKMLTDLFLGVKVDPGASGGAGIDSDFARSISNTAWAARCPVDSTLRCRLLQALCGSGAAANLFPAGLRCGIIAVFDQGSSSKLRFGGMRYLLWIFRRSSEAVLLATAPFVLQGLRRSLSQVQFMQGCESHAASAPSFVGLNVDPDYVALRELMYEAVAVLAGRAPALLVEDEEIAKMLFRAAASEPPELRVSVAEALSLVLTAYSSPNVKVTVISRIKSLVLSFAFESEYRCRLNAVSWALKLFDYSDVSIRALCLLLGASGMGPRGDLFVVVSIFLSLIVLAHDDHRAVREAAARGLEPPQSRPSVSGREHFGGDGTNPRNGVPGRGADFLSASTAVSPELTAAGAAVFPEFFDFISFFSGPGLSSTFGFSIITLSGPVLSGFLHFSMRCLQAEATRWFQSKDLTGAEAHELHGGEAAFSGDLRCNVVTGMSEDDFRAGSSVQELQSDIAEWCTSYMGTSSNAVSSTLRTSADRFADFLSLKFLSSRLDGFSSTPVVRNSRRTVCQLIDLVSAADITTSSSFSASFTSLLVPVLEKNVESSRETDLMNSLPIRVQVEPEVFYNCESFDIVPTFAIEVFVRRAFQAHQDFLMGSCASDGQNAKRRRSFVSKDESSLLDANYDWAKLVSALYRLLDVATFSLERSGGIKSSVSSAIPLAGVEPRSYGRGGSSGVGCPVSVFSCEDLNSVASDTIRQLIAMCSEGCGTYFASSDRVLWLRRWLLCDSASLRRNMGEIFGIALISSLNVAVIAQTIRELAEEAVETNLVIPSVNRSDAQHGAVVALASILFHGAPRQNSILIADSRQMSRVYPEAGIHPEREILDTRNVLYSALQFGCRVLAACLSHALVDVRWDALVGLGRLARSGHLLLPRGDCSASKVSSSEVDACEAVNRAVLAALNLSDNTGPFHTFDIHSDYEWSGARSFKGLDSAVVSSQCGLLVELRRLVAFGDNSGEAGIRFAVAAVEAMGEWASGDPASPFRSQILRYLLDIWRLDSSKSSKCEDILFAAGDALVKICFPFRFSEQLLRCFKNFSSASSRSDGDQPEAAVLFDSDATVGLSTGEHNHRKSYPKSHFGFPLVILSPSESSRTGFVTGFDSILGAAEIGSVKQREEADGGLLEMPGSSIMLALLSRITYYRRSVSEDETGDVDPSLYECIRIAACSAAQSAAAAHGAILCDPLSFVLSHLIKLGLHGRMLLGDGSPVAAGAAAAVATWLLCLITDFAHLPQVQLRAEKLQDTLSMLLAERGEFTQESAAKALSLLYHTCGSQTRKQLLHSLLASLAAGRRAVAGMAVPSGQASHSSGALGGSVEISPNGWTSGGGTWPASVYRDIWAIANDLGKPELFYLLLAISAANSVWKSARAQRFSPRKLFLSDARNQLLPSLMSLIPRLFRYRFEPNIRARSAMEQLWMLLVEDESVTVKSCFSAILKEQLRALGSSKWRERQAAAASLSPLLTGVQFYQIIDELGLLWRSLLRVADDLKDSVREVSNATLKVLEATTTRLCDGSFGTSPNAVIATVEVLSSGSGVGPAATSRVVAVVLPVLMDYGLCNASEDVRGISMRALLRIIRVSGRSMVPFLPKLLGLLIEAQSALEPAALAYLQFHTGAYDVTQTDMERARIASSRSGPLQEALDLCLVEVDAATISGFAPILAGLLRGSVGLASRCAAARTAAAIASTHPNHVRGFASDWLKALTSGLTDRSPTARTEYATAVAAVARLAPAVALRRLVQRMCDLYEGASGNCFDDPAGAASGGSAIGESWQRLIAGKTLRFTLRGSTSGSSSSSGVSILPEDALDRALSLTFMARHDSDDEVRDVWTALWNESVPSLAAGVRLHGSAILRATLTRFVSPSWLARRQASLSMAEVLRNQSFEGREWNTDAEDGSVIRSDRDQSNGHLVNEIISLLLKAIPGRIWDGKEAVIEALTEGVIFAAASLPSGVTPDAAVLGSALDKDNSNEAKYGGSDGKSQSNVRSHQSSYLEVVKIILGECRPHCPNSYRQSALSSLARLLSAPRLNFASASAFDVVAPVLYADLASATFSPSRTMIMAIDNPEIDANVQNMHNTDPITQGNIALAFAAAFPAVRAPLNHHSASAKALELLPLSRVLSALRAQVLWADRLLELIESRLIYGGLEWNVRVALLCLLRSFVQRVYLPPLVATGSEFDEYEPLPLRRTGIEALFRCIANAIGDAKYAQMRAAGATIVVALLERKTANFSFAAYKEELWAAVRSCSTDSDPKVLELASTARLLLNGWP